MCEADRRRHSHSSSRLFFFRLSSSSVRWSHHTPHLPCLRSTATVVGRVRGARARQKRRVLREYKARVNIGHRMDPGGGPVRSPLHYEHVSYHSPNLLYDDRTACLSCQIRIVRLPAVRAASLRLKFSRPAASLPKTETTFSASARRATPTLWSRCVLRSAHVPWLC